MDNRNHITTGNEVIDSLLAEEQLNSQLPCTLPTPTKEDILRKQVEHYDLTRYRCIAFKGKNELWKGQYIPLGNMNGGFEYSFCGITVPTSEHAYILGFFSNNTSEYETIQLSLLAETNGYLAKRKIRRQHEVNGRADWAEFNLDWMIFCVYNKALNNKEFRDILLSIPLGVTIIEDSSFKPVPTEGEDKDSFWGARNAKRREFGKLARRYAKSLRLSTKKATREIKDNLMSEYCNAGEFVGVNTMGKVLTYVKDCLHMGIEPDINYKLLEEKDIYILGRKVSFEC